MTKTMFEVGKNGELKLYQQRAQDALPILVRQAKARKPIYYSNLARELNMANPRNLNKVLGSVGNTLLELSNKWNEEIPMINSLVINKNTDKPGDGIDEFLSDSEIYYSKLSLRDQRNLIEKELEKVFLYQKWDRVLQELGLEPVKDLNRDDLESKSRFGAGGGEGENHKRLKDFIASNPNVIKFPKIMNKTVKEYRLPSGDSIDIFFEKGDNWFGVEVKSGISDVEDIKRGLFQCVKYQAVLEAFMASLGLAQNVKVVLALGGELPDELVALRNILGVEVRDNLEQLL